MPSTHYGTVDRRCGISGVQHAHHHSLVCWSTQTGELVRFACAAWWGQHKTVGGFDTVNTTYDITVSKCWILNSFHLIPCQYCSVSTANYRTLTLYRQFSAAWCGIDLRRARRYPTLLGMKAGGARARHVWVLDATMVDLTMIDGPGVADCVTRSNIVYIHVGRKIRFSKWWHLRGCGRNLSTSRQFVDL